MFYYINQLGLCYCVKDQQLSYLQKRKCGLKLENEWFVNLYEVYYVMNYRECKLHVGEWDLGELVDDEELRAKKVERVFEDCLDLLQTLKLETNELGAYMTLRNEDKWLRLVRVPKQAQVNYIQEQLMHKGKKKIRSDDQKLEEPANFQFKPANYILYESLQDYQSNKKGQPLYLFPFDIEIQEGLIRGEKNFIVGLMENCGVKLIKIQDFKI